ncbi:MAG: OmpA family protein [Pararhodobacter sp.]|nr:OmpA family protein [Pararhodobacter sp.]
MTILGRLAPVAAFALALVSALGVAALLAGWVERHNERQIAQVMTAEELDWVSFSTDGLRATLWGMAPDEPARLRALRMAGTVVAPGRIDEEMVVATTSLVLTPDFRIEVMRNHDEISVIGLMPGETDEAALLDRLAAIESEMTVADMLQSANHPAPEGWRGAVDFAVSALAILPVAQLSVTPRQVEVHALVADAAQQAALSGQLRELAPADVRLVLDLTAPRPVIAPYALRFEIDEDSPRLSACAAETPAARGQLIRAARAAGAQGQVVCALGLGAPSPRWSDAGALAIAALADLGAGQLSIVDADILITVPHDLPQARLDRVVGRLETNLPDIFALRIEQFDPPSEDEPVAASGPTLRATLSEEGLLLIEGRLPDSRIRNAVNAYARARFGTGAVTLEARLDPDMAPGWSARALTGLEALAELHHGTLLMTADRLELTGTSGNPDAGTQIAGILAEGLGQSAEHVLRIEYDEALDPVAQAPTPERCEARVQEVLQEYSITFAPGSANLDAESREALDRIAAVLIECGELPLEVAGHTDSQGREATNLALSQSRAEAVVNALMTRRVLVASMEPRGYGAALPIADNATAEGREANRRIEITLIRPEPDPEPIDPALEELLEFEIQSVGDDTLRPEPRPAR